MAHEACWCVPRCIAAYRAATDCRCTTGCELTPGLEPLLCTCGNHSAHLQSEQANNQIWQIFAVKQAGRKPRIVTSRAQKRDARDVVVALCNGSYQQNRPRAAPIHTARIQQQRSAKIAQNTTPAEPRATRIAGPGRGHKGKRVSQDDSVAEAERVLKKGKVQESEWRHALGRMRDDHKLLCQWSEKVLLASQILVILCRLITCFDRLITYRFCRFCCRII